MAGPLTALAIGTLLGEDGPSEHSDQSRRGSSQSGGHNGDEEAELEQARNEDAAIWDDRDREQRGDEHRDTENREQTGATRHAEIPRTSSPGHADDASSQDEQRADLTLPKYRWTPILSGLLQPFAILLEIPGLTEHWYVRLDRATNMPVAYQNNPPLLNAALAISVVCAVIANVSLICRFLERHVLASTITCIVALSIHDIINIIVLSIFGVIHSVDDGFDYSQAFWLCVCSTAASFFTNCTLVYDIMHTKDFRHSGSGLTVKQRNLVIVVMILLAYLALGALVFFFLIPDLNFQSALYFTVVSIETIGFGDIAPAGIGARIFLFFYLPSGIFLLAIAVGTTRSTLLEWAASTYKRRRHRILLGYRTRKLQREEESAKQAEIDRQLARYSMGRVSKKPKLKLEIPSHGDIGRVMMAEMEASCPSPKRRVTLSPLSPLSVQETSTRLVQEGGEQDPRTEALRLQAELQRQSAENEAAYRDMQETLSRQEKMENWAKLGLAISLFVIFWIVGATVFARTEDWNWFVGFYFCFVTFTSVGYGDQVPTSPAGRAFFLIWAMLGVGNVTILIAVIADGYSDRLRSILKRKGPRAIVRERVKEWAHSADIGPANTPKAHKHSDFAAEIVDQLTTLHNQVNILRIIDKHGAMPGDPELARLDGYLKGYMQECGMPDEEQREVMADAEMRRSVFFKAYERTVVRLLSVAAVAARTDTSTAEPAKTYILGHAGAYGSMRVP